MLPHLRSPRCIYMVHLGRSIFYRLRGYHYIPSNYYKCVRLLHYPIRSNVFQNGHRLCKKWLFPEIVKTESELGSIADSLFVLNKPMSSRPPSRILCHIRSQQV